MILSDVGLKNIILPSFHDLWKVVRSGKLKDVVKTFFVCKGGRNSAKSSNISIMFILLIVMLPVNGLAIRKVGATLQESVYEQLKEAINWLGLEGSFRCYKQPLKIVYLSRGNYIIFRGADDPLKIKSIKTSKYPIAIVWFEEISEFKTEEEVQVINDSILRATLPDGIQYRIFYSYNPPKRKQNWVNKKFETQFITQDVYIHHSSYLDNFHLSEQTLTSINELKESNINKYNWVYGGQPIGGGVIPFENLEFRPITNEEIEQFDNIRQGIDWGYAVDPACFLRSHYDRTRRKLYIFDEIYGVKMSNRELSERIRSKGYEYDLIIADSAEPKSIAELKESGISIKGARKGQGSVEYGEKWLDDLDAIIIDPGRCPNTASEFEMIDYEVDKDGKQKAKLEDKNNHSIDTARYMCEDDMEKTGVYF